MDNNHLPLSLQLPMETSRPRTLSEQIAESLTRRIVDGRYPVGAKLPTERELAVEFGANRNAIREAIKRLEALGVVQSRRGAGTFVEGIALGTAIQFLDSLITHEDGSVNLESLRDLLEFRGNIARLIARAAAVRRTEEELTRLHEMARERHRCRSNQEKLKQITANIFSCIAEASHNRAYLVMYDTTSKAHLQLWSAIDLPKVGPNRLDRALETLLAAFEQQDPVQAELVVVRLMEDMQRALFNTVDPLVSAPFTMGGPPATTP